jgi:hypothetical protein
MLGGSIEREQGDEAAVKAETRKITSPVFRLSGFPPLRRPRRGFAKPRLEQQIS